MIEEHRRINRPIFLPDIEKFPQHLGQRPYAPFEFMKVSVFDAVISRHTLENYLTKPDEFLKVCHEVVEYAANLHDNPNHSWRKHMDFNLYDVLVGHWKPMALSPWNCVDHSDDYLTVFARDPYQNYDPISVRHYVSLNKHNEILLQKQSEIAKIVQTEIRAGFDKTVARAVEEKATTIEKIERERRNLEQQKAEIERKLAALEKAETKAIEREQAKANRSPRSTAGYVYVLQAQTGEYKIGRTSDPDDRIKTFNVKLPMRVEYTCLIRTDDMYTLERKLHSKYMMRHIDGEWFNLTARDLQFLRRLATLAGGNDE